MSGTGLLQAVILDWAGTTVDHGSRGPVAALRKAFADRGVEITAEEARRHMGLLKMDHIRRIVAIERVAEGDAVFSPRLAGFVLDAFAGHFTKYSARLASAADGRRVARRRRAAPRSSG